MQTTCASRPPKTHATREVGLRRAHLIWARPGTSDSAESAGNWVEYDSAADYLRSAKEGRSGNQSAGSGHGPDPARAPPASRISSGSSIREDAVAPEHETARALLPPHPHRPAARGSTAAAAPLEVGPPSAVIQAWTRLSRSTATSRSRRRLHLRPASLSSAASTRTSVSRTVRNRWPPASSYARATAPASRGWPESTICCRA